MEPLSNMQMGLRIMKNSGQTEGLAIHDVMKDMMEQLIDENYSLAYVKDHLKEMADQFVGFAKAFKRDLDRTGREY